MLKIRQRMRQEFEKNRFVDNLDVKNMMIFRGTAELEETLYKWKTTNHVMKYFKEDYETKATQKKGFLQEFYE